MQNNSAELVEKLTQSITMLSSVVSICVAGFTKKEQLDDIAKFFEKVDKKGFDRSLEQSMDSIRAKSSWLARDSDDVSGWLKEKGYLEKGKL